MFDEDSTLVIPASHNESMINAYKAKAPTRNQKSVSNQLSKSFLATKGSDSTNNLNSSALIKNKNRNADPKLSKTPGQLTAHRPSLTNFTSVINPSMRQSLAPK